VLIKVDGSPRADFACKNLPHSTAKPHNEILLHLMRCLWRVQVQAQRVSLFCWSDKSGWFSTREFCFKIRDGAPQTKQWAITAIDAVLVDRSSPNALRICFLFFHLRSTFYSKYAFKIFFSPPY
jgi:hypothetical protein